MVMLLIAGFFAYGKYKEMYPYRPPAATARPIVMKSFADINQIEETGFSRGRKAGNGKLAVVFSDYECPYCSQYPESDQYQTLTHTDSVRLTLVAFPLGMHKSAKPAAMAAFCAAESGQFWEADTFLHQNFDALPKVLPELEKRWSCSDSTFLHRQKRLRDGNKLVQQLKVQLTPSILLAEVSPSGLTGTLYPGAVPEDKFESWIK
jgi:protein-disulfide isomerase